MLIFTLNPRSLPKADLFTTKTPGFSQQSVVASELKSADGNKSLETALKLQEQAKQKFSSDEYDEAFDLLDFALQVLKDAPDVDPVYSANMYFDLGFYFFHDSQTAAAREALNNAYEIYNKGDHLDKSFDALDFLAVTYENDPVGGRDIYEKIIKQKEEKLGKSDGSLVKTYIQYGLWHSKHQRDPNAIENLKKASKITDELTKTKKEDAGPLYKQLMRAYKQVNALPEAIEAANSALKYSDINKNPKFLVDIAELYSQANKTEESVKYYEKYLEIIRKNDDNNFREGKILKAIATEFEKHDADDKALNYWSKFNNLFRENSNKEIALMSVYGKLRAFALYHRRNKFGEATKELEEAVNKATEIGGEKHVYSLTLQKVLSTYKNSNQKENKPRLDIDSLTLMLIALEDNLQKLIDTGFINL